jgi:glycosyltransferase involved in cell wall biosynthesis
MLSVITINMNDATNLELSMRSVLCQDCLDFEYLIVDGSSTDGSVDIIKKYEERIAWWVSEPDGGIYSAMNKGILRAKGEYCLFLNSGDCLIRDDILSRIQGALRDDVDVLYSDALMLEDGKRRLSRYPKNVSAGYFLVNTLNHQNAVIKRSLLLDLGLYREDMRIASDWFFFLRAASERRAFYRHFPFPIVLYKNDGISSTAEGAARNVRERAQGIGELFPGMMPVVEELAGFHESVYGSIVRHYGSSGLLVGLLRAYRFAARCVSLFSKVR